MNCGRRPHLPKNCAQSDPPFRECRFWQISLNSAAAMRTSEKSWIIGNRKSTMRIPSSHKWTPCVTPKFAKGGSKWEFLHLALPFISLLQVIADTLNLVCEYGMWFEHSKFQPTDDKLSLRWAWPHHVTHFKPLDKLSLERLKLETSNLVCMLIIASPSLRTTNCPWKLELLVHCNT